MIFNKDFIEHIFSYQNCNGSYNLLDSISNSLPKTKRPYLSANFSKEFILRSIFANSINISSGAYTLRLRNGGISPGFAASELFSVIAEDPE